MNRTSSVILLLAAVIMVMVIDGCSSDTSTPVTTPTTITVSGKVLDTYGNPLTAASTVLIGTQSATTGGDGGFTINNVTTPYDVYVLNPNTGVFAVKGLTIANPFIPGAINTPPSQTLSVTVPTVPAGSRATVIFQDTVTGKVSGFGQITAGNSSGTLTIGGITGQSVAGKLAVIEYTIAAGIVTGYTGYAEQQVSFSIGGSPIYNFATLAGGLGQSTISGTVNSSGGANLEAQLYINFTTKNNVIHRGGFIQSILISGNSGSFSFNVPTGTTSAGQFNVVALTPNPPNSWIGQRMKTLAAGSSGSVISIDSSGSLLTPPNNASGVVDSTTQFSFSSSSGTSVHFIRIYPTGPTGKTYQILLKGSNITLPNLSKYGYGFDNAAAYSWFVGSTYDIGSVDDYCSQLFDLNPAILATVQTPPFNFTSH